MSALLTDARLPATTVKLKPLVSHFHYISGIFLNLKHTIFIVYTSASCLCEIIQDYSINNNQYRTLAFTCVEICVDFGNLIIISGKNGCIDSGTDCAARKAAGMCISAPQKMIKECRDTCNACFIDQSKHNQLLWNFVVKPRLLNYCHCTFCNDLLVERKHHLNSLTYCFCRGYVSL